MNDRCETCRGPNPAADTPAPLWTNCIECQRVCDVYRRQSHVSADANFALHELAHHILLFRRLPRRRRDWNEIERTINRFSAGHAQDHELRTLAFQYVAYSQLGWRPSLNWLVSMSWPGIEDVARDESRHTDNRTIVWSEHQAHRRMRALLPHVSRRYVDLYTRIVRRWRATD